MQLICILKLIGLKYGCQMFGQGCDFVLVIGTFTVDTPLFVKYMNNFTYASLASANDRWGEKIAIPRIKIIKRCMVI